MDKKFKIAIGLGILVVVAIAYMDIMGLTFFKDLGVDYTCGEFPGSYWIFFRNTALILMMVVPLCYYFFYRRDKSEAMAIFLTSFLIWMFGFADILYFLLQGKGVPDVLPWLNNHMFIGRVAHFLGYSQVTSFTLWISVFIGFGIALFLAKLLKEKL